MTTASATKWLTVAEVAKQIRRDPQTVRRYARKKLIEGTKVNGYQYLFTQESVDAFLEAGAISEPEPEEPLPSRNPRYATR